ncbi:OmpH family outer membrane protein [Flavobacterium rhizosphaerae]|uniref:OmpH family outer membrane protein n=1 Tax=Flavobacterium rhizosphaerae TaxID=3163298 RepID=A0ABW8Z2P1_9FLAO
MKKTLLIVGFALALFSCDKQQSSEAGMKTAYVDIAKLSKDYEAFKDLESQSKIKEGEMGRELQADVKQYQEDRAAAEHQAATKGPQWVQLKAQEFQKREQDITAKQQQMAQNLQEEFGAKNDSAVNVMKKYIGNYGKEKGYDYIYSTSDISSIIYAKEGYDLTDEILKALNEEYKKNHPDVEKPAKDETPETK